MVVVAIIGILAAIAIPNYQRYQARTRQSEGKIFLSAVYTAEQSFFAESGTFTLCLQEIGADANLVARRYYTKGFNIGNSACGPTGTLNCMYYTFSGTSGGKLCAINSPFSSSTAKVNASTSLMAVPPPVSGGGITAIADQDSFISEAAGNVSSDPLTDFWSIDQNKTLVNFGPGI